LGGGSSEEGGWERGEGKKGWLNYVGKTCCLDFIVTEGWGRREQRRGGGERKKNLEVFKLRDGG